MKTSISFTIPFQSILPNLATMTYIPHLTKGNPDSFNVLIVTIISKTSHLQLTDTQWMSFIYFMFTSQHYSFSKMTGRQKFFHTHLEVNMEIRSISIIYRIHSNIILNFYELLKKLLDDKTVFHQYHL